MRPSVRLATCLVAVLSCSLAIPPTRAVADAFTATSTLTYLGSVGGQQQFRYDYTLTNTGEPLGLTAFRTFFNSDPISQLPSGDRSTFVSYGAPASWGDVFVFAKNADGQWYVEWNYDFVSPPGPLGVGQSLTGFSVTFDWNDPSMIPPYQHAQASDGSAHDGFAHVVALVNVNGTIGGHVTSTCGGSTGPAAGVVVMLLHDSQVFADATTDASGDYTFPGVPVGTYTVVVVPPAGYGTTVDNTIVSLTQVDEVVSANFALTCQLGTVCGTVTGSCNGSTAGLQGITVDLFGIDGQGNDVLLAVGATDATGAFSFPNVALGDYHVVIVTPLGYTGPVSQSVSLTTAGGTVCTEFGLACQTITSEPHTIGYWKHQVSSYLSGKGRAQESLDDMLRYTDLLLVHFNQNIVNPVVIYVPESNVPGDRLWKLEQLLTVNKTGTMLDRAKQQLLALLLNVVSGKISQTQVISPDGATVSQAITYANDLIQDSDPANDETAKTIADLINNGSSVPSGMVPVDTRMVTYRSRPSPTETAGASFQLAPAYPNPSRGNVVTLGFSLTRGGAAALQIYDVNGRVVRKLAQGEFSAGPHSLTWDGRDESGRLSGPGVYFYRLTAAEGSLVRSVTLNR
jgi:hypothetical protein